MSVYDDVKQFTTNLVKGDLRAALGDVSKTVHDVLSPGRPSGSGQISVPSIPGTIPSGNAPHEGGSCSGVVVPPPVRSAEFAGACCDRFRFDSGFLVDGATGSVWQYDQKSKSFEEVPVNHGKTKQSLIDGLVEDRLSDLKRQYESEVLATLPPALRATKLASFDKQYLVPLRNAARTLRS